MTLSDFLTAVQAIADARPAYKLGHAGDDGYCDCIGLIIGACERNGIEWTGVHGTNWWARHYTDSLMGVTDADDLALGDIVYKARNPGAGPFYDANGIIVASVDGTKPIMYSVDGMTWTASNLSFITHKPSGFLNVNGIWVAGIGGGGLLYSQTWAPPTQSEV